LPNLRQRISFAIGRTVRSTLGFARSGTILACVRVSAICATGRDLRLPAAGV